MMKYKNWSDPYLAKPNDFNQSIDDVFREIYELTSRANVKMALELIDNLLLKVSKLVVCALHTTMLTQIEDHLHSRFELAFLGEAMDVGLVHTFGSSNSQRVLIVDMTRGDWLEALFVMKEYFPFGIPILMTEMVWNLPKSKESEMYVQPHREDSVNFT